MLGEQVGSYRIKSRIGVGGMGAVYLAEHELIGRKAAIKVLLPELGGDEASLTRFFDEARATAMIRHPGLVDVFDFGRSASGAAYIAMELLEGESLGARLRRDGPLPEPLIVELGRQLTSALAAAHAHGIVHRDLKPDNIFLVPDHAIPCGLRVKVLDFGIAKLSAQHKAGARRTTTGSLLGTPLYMSPEQCRGTGEVSAQSDVYSLGCIFYESAVGEPPFMSEGVGELISAHMNDPPRAARLSRPELSQRLDALITTMLAKAPAERPTGMSGVAAALEGRSPSREEAAPTMAQASGTSRPRPAADTTLRRSVGQQTVRPGNRLTLGLIGAALTAGAVLLAIWLMRREPRRSDAPHEPERAAVPDKGVVVVSPLPGATAVDAGAAAQVTLQLDSEPVGAEVYRAFDGIRMGQTPLRLQLAPTAGEAVFVLRLTGHRDRKVSLPADRDGTLRIRLDPTSAPLKLKPIDGAPTVTAPAKREPVDDPPVKIKPVDPAHKRIGDGTID